MKILLLNTLKISLAAIIATLLALGIGLEFYTAAGIIAILSIQSTKRETLKVALGRFLAFLVALSIAFVCFQLLGFTVLAYALYLVAYIFICLYFKWNMAMAMNSVLISHFLTKGNMDMPLLLNELALFAIGVGLGILTNLHLRKNIDYIERLRKEADYLIQGYLIYISQLIKQKETPIADFFPRMNRSIRLAKNLAEENFQNQLKDADRYDQNYIAMREKQSYVLLEMEKIASRIHMDTLSTEIVASFLSRIAIEYGKDNTAQDLLTAFHAMWAGLKEKPLPTVREEFENRARLFILLQHVEEFLELKADFVVKLQDTKNK